MVFLISLKSTQRGKRGNGEKILQTSYVHVPIISSRVMKLNLYSMELNVIIRPCAGNKFCVNTEGSFRCMRCDKSCDGCDGDGPDNCAKCGDGYVKNKVQYL